MFGANPNDVVRSDYARKLIKFKARQLSRRPGFNQSDIDDLEQEIALVILTYGGGFDPERASLHTFLDRVVSSAARRILRDRGRLKRAAGNGAQSLESMVADRDGMSRPIGETITASDTDRRTGGSRCSDIEDFEFADAFQAAWGSLPAEIADVCRRVMERGITAAADELGVSRRQIRNALAIARVHFAAAGLGD
jgi:DNA-directed RNA polymerase specialized sigma24 family protein